MTLRVSPATTTGSRRSASSSWSSSSSSSSSSMLLLLLLLSKRQAAASVNNATTTASGIVDDYGIFDWVRKARKGFYHPDQVFRADPATGITGVFASKDIAKGTILVSVPWSHVIPSDDPTEDGQLCCGLVDRLAREWKLGNHSKFAPYIQYLQENFEKTMHHQIPTMWSPHGKVLLQAIVGTTRDDNNDNTKDKTILPPEDPFKWFVEEWFPRCGGSPKDKLGIKATLVVIQRSDDAILIPGYDMYNHRNGKWFNADAIQVYGVKHETVATRDIKAGEQIFISYNKCHGCVGRVHEYGTGEILRDYGFVEMMPQIFWYQYHHLRVQFELDEAGNHDSSSNDDKFIELTWDDEWSMPKDPSNRKMLVGFFRRQIRRLQRLYNIDYHNGKNPGMPEHEWETAWQFQQANIRAMTLAMKSMLMDASVDNKYRFNMTEVNMLVNSPHYDPLGEEADDLFYSQETCDNNDALSHVHHTVVDSQGTYYQTMTFLIEPDSKDVVLELDSITQIASVYRPHYHEYSVHAAARFLDSVKRVIFIGGGDSMLLHEVLKYPELELVVGLELDQVVTRKSFRYFLTQPHFDDPRVEWWFGDATKTLLLLPMDYWQSFDLVLVDLSETVMSLSVTSELDVFDALALLLKPEGVLVKNELYMDQISKVFDHTVQICYQSPIICDQVLTMGSNKVDFMHAPVKDHGVETLLYTPLVTKDNRHELLHDYRRNDARSQGKCNLEVFLAETTSEQSKSAGILEVIEAENIPFPLNASLLPVLEKVVQDVGFGLSSESVHDDGLLMILMNEGYVLVRMVPEKEYCNLDIKLWGGFHKLKSLSSSLTKALGAGLVSNYRVVAGGMYGSSTWKEDRALIGPQIAQNRDCTTPDTTEADKKKILSEETLFSAALEETMTNLVNRTDSLAVVFCGSEGDKCLVAEVLKTSKRISNVVKLSTCSTLDAAVPTTLYDCELSILEKWKEELGGHLSNIVAVDPTAPLELLQIINSILSNDATRKSLISETNVFLAMTSKPSAEPWRQHFLDRYRKQHQNDPVSRAAFSMQDGPLAIEFGVVSAGDEALAYHLEKIETGLKTQFENVNIQLEVIHGGKYAYWDPWEPKEFLQSDYDESPGLEQYFAQSQLAQHSLIQLGPIDGSDFEFSTKVLTKIFQKSLAHNDFKCTTKFIVDNVGDGSVMVCLNNEYGSAVLAWDGRQHIEISYYLADEDETEFENFLASFKALTRHRLDVVLRDDMPRGTGRIVNYAEDILTKGQREQFFESLLATDEERTEQIYMERALGQAEKVKEGSCSNPGADDQTCWPEPPPL